MLFSETLLFILALITSGCTVFLLIYFIITLSDLECDYLNAQECCENLNYWIIPKYIVHSFTTFILLIHGKVWLFIGNLPMFIWLTYQYLTIPRGDIGVYDPAEIHNKGQLKKYMRHVVIHVGYYLVLFFIYLYFFILALLKAYPVPRQRDEEIVTEVDQL